METVLLPERIRFPIVVSLINLLIHMMNARWRHSPRLTQVILEKTIIKLGSLLALGFGEASVSIGSTEM